MIHIATVHWESDEWIDLQISMFKEHIHKPFRVYGYLTNIDRRHLHHFHKYIDSPDTTHASKLNALADLIVDDAEEDDWLMFIDGDAFPVAEMVPRVATILERSPLVAIQRLENLGEKHAHPSFCITTVGVWKRIKGNWNRGYHWINALNVEETDAGGELLRSLTTNNISWTPLHRTNREDILPVWYGIYGDLIYHHGAGFRSRGCRKVWYQEGLYHIYRRLDARILNNVTPAKYLKSVRDSMLHPEGRMKRRIGQRLTAVDLQVKKELFQNPQRVMRRLRGEAFSE